MVEPPATDPRMVTRVEYSGEAEYLCPCGGVQWWLVYYHRAQSARFAQCKACGRIGDNSLGGAGMGTAETATPGGNVRWLRHDRNTELDANSLLDAAEEEMASPAVALGNIAGAMSILAEHHGDCTICRPVYERAGFVMKEATDALFGKDAEPLEGAGNPIGEPETPRPPSTLLRIVGGPRTP